MLVRLPPQQRLHGDQRIWAELKEGVQLALGDPGCRSAISLIGIVAVTASPFIALVPAMAITVLHAGKEATSYLVGAQGVGAVIGALAVTPLADRIGRRAVVVGSLFGAPIAIACYGLAPDIAVSALTMVVVGACYIGILTGLNTTIQLRAPATARGRILSLYMLVLGVGYPVGAVIQGAIGQQIGVREVTIAGAVVMMAALVAIRAQKPEVLGSLGEGNALAGSSAVVAVDG
jgi:predicted MFS family arabinose efflux permease